MNIDAQYDYMSKEILYRYTNDAKVSRGYDDVHKKIFTALLQSCDRLIDTTIKYRVKGVDAGVLRDKLMNISVLMDSSLNSIISEYMNVCQSYIFDTNTNSPDWYNKKTYGTTNIFDIFDNDNTKSDNEGLYNPFDSDSIYKDKLFVDTNFSRNNNNNSQNTNDRRIRKMKLHRSSDIGDSNVENNFNYHIHRLVSDDYIFAGHEQSVRYCHSTQSSKVIKHNIPLLFHQVSYNHFDIYFPKNNEVIIMEGSKKYKLNNKFRGSYMGGKWDARSRGVQLIGNMLYFQSLPTDLVAYNLDMYIASYNDEYNGDKISSDVESFTIDSMMNIYIVSIDGKIWRHNSSICTNNNDKISSNTSEATRLYTFINKIKSHVVVSYYVEKYKKTGYTLYNDNLKRMDEVELDRQSSHVHVIVCIDLCEYSCFISLSLYTVCLFAIINDEIISLDVNLAPSETMMNSVVYDGYNRIVTIADTKRLVKIFRIE